MSQLLYLRSTTPGASLFSSPGSTSPPPPPPSTATYDVPLLPDGSETCMDDFGKALREREIELTKPNETCDVVCCYCGIRLHPLSCPEAPLELKGKLVGNVSVKKLKKDCSNVNGFPGLGDPAAMVNPMNDHIVHRGHGVFDTAAIMDGYRNLIERALRARLVHGSPNMNRVVSFEYRCVCQRNEDLFSDDNFW